MKKIRFNGKALTKFDIAYMVDKIAPLSCATIIFEHLTYRELVEMLYRQMKLKLPTYVDQVNWQNYI